MTKLNNKWAAIKAATHFVTGDVCGRFKSTLAFTPSPNARKPRMETGKYIARTAMYAIVIEELKRLGFFMSHWIVGNAAVPPNENAIAPNATWHPKEREREQFKSTLKKHVIIS